MNQLPTINLFHVFFVAPLLFYIGYMNNYTNMKVHKMVYNLLILLAVLVLFFHSWKAYNRI